VAAPWGMRWSRPVSLCWALDLAECCSGGPDGLPAVLAFRWVPNYSLLMGRNVKAQDGRSGRPRDRTKVSSKHQVTIPSGAFRTAGLEAGDMLRVEARGAGQIMLTRVDELVDRYSGCLDTGGELRERRDKLREEWR